jgi:hypothetical protein
MPSLAERALAELGSEADSFTVPAAPAEARGGEEPTFDQVAARMTAKPAAAEPVVESTPEPAPEGETVAADNTSPFADVLEQIAKAEAASKPAETTPTETPTTDFFAQAQTRYPETIGRYKSPEDLVEGHLNLRKKLSERDQEAELGRLARENPQAILDWYKQQAPQLFENTPPVAEAVVAPDDLEMELLKYVAVDKMPPDLRKRAESWAAQKQIEKVPIVQSLKQEIAALKQQLGKAPEVTPESVDQTVHQRLAFQAEANKAATYVHAHRKGLFEQGDPSKGFNNVGREWSKGAKWAEERGCGVDECIAEGERWVKARFGQLLNGSKTPDAAQHRNTRANAAPVNEGKHYDGGLGLSGSIFAKLGLNADEG